MRRLWRRLFPPRCIWCGARRDDDFDPASEWCDRGRIVIVNGMDDPHEWSRQ